MTQSIFRNPGTELREFLTDHAHDEILYVSIDVVKHNYSSMAINLFVEVITSKFDFPYNNHGIEFFRKKLNTAQKQTHARKLRSGTVGEVARWRGSKGAWRRSSER